MTIVMWCTKKSKIVSQQKPLEDFDIHGSKSFLVFPYFLLLFILSLYDLLCLAPNLPCCVLCHEPHWHDLSTCSLYTPVL